MKYRVMQFHGMEQQSKNKKIFPTETRHQFIHETKSRFKTHNLHAMKPIFDFKRAVVIIFLMNIYVNTYYLIIYVLVNLQKI